MGITHLLFPEIDRHIQSSTMKLFIITTLLAVAVAAPAELDAPVAIVSSRSEMNLDGSYSFAFETEDGVKVEESGSQKQVGETAEDVGTVSQGSYSYTGPDGVVVTVNWVADENGFQPPEITCPPRHPCLSMLSSSWLI